MHIDIPHKFKSPAEATARVKSALNDARPQLGDKATIEKEEWEGNTLTFAATIQGQTISGTMVVRDTVYDINAKLPLMLRMFEGRIERTLKEQTAKMLEEQGK